MLFNDKEGFICYFEINICIWNNLTPADQALRYELAELGHLVVVGEHFLMQFMLILDIYLGAVLPIDCSASYLRPHFLLFSAA